MGLSTTLITQGIGSKTLENIMWRFPRTSPGEVWKEINISERRHVPSAALGDGGEDHFIEDIQAHRDKAVCPVSPNS